MKMGSSQGQLQFGVFWIFNDFYKTVSGANFWGLSVFTESTES